MDMEKEVTGYLYVMDISDNTISRISIYEDMEDTEPEDILKEKGFDPNYCQWMYSPALIEDIIKF